MAHSVYSVVPVLKLNQNPQFFTKTPGTKMQLP